MSIVDRQEADQLEPLYRLGLTRQQAKMYLALARRGQATVSELSKLTRTDRGETYRVVGQLLEKSLVSKVLTSPARFEVTSFGEGLDSLFEKKKEEMLRLTNDLERIRHNLRIADNGPFPTQEKTWFAPVSDAFFEDAKKRFATSQESISILTDLYRCESVQDKFLREEKKALERGVDFKMLICDPYGRFDLKKLPVVRTYLKEPSFSLRISSEVNSAPIAIYDSKIAELYISKETHISKSSPIVTNNERIVKLAQVYFNGLWNKAREVKLEEN